MTTQAEERDLPGWQRPFFTVWIGQVFSLLGSSLVGFALIWWITEETGSATVLATVTLVSMLPSILIGPFAGALVDRWNRRRTMMAADSIIALVSLMLAVLFLTGRAQVWQVYVVMVLRGLGGTFHWPAMQASTSLMVPEKQLARVAGMNQTLNGVMNIFAPPLAALLLELLPVGKVLLIDVITAIIGVSALFLVAIPQPKRKEGPLGARPASLIQDMSAGFRYIASWRGLLVLMLMAMSINFLISPAFSLLPILVTKHFGGQAIQLGLINSAWGVGVVAGGLALSAWGGFRKKIYTTLMGVAGMGVGITLIGVAPAEAFLLAVVGMALAGAMNPMANGPLFAIFQSSVSPEMQGRVFALINTLAGAITPLSLAVAGPLADRFGVQVWYQIAGVACLFAAGAALFSPAVMKIEEQGRELA